MRLRHVVALGAIWLAQSSVAHADDPQPPPPKRSGVYWHDEWPRFTVLEGMISAAVTARNADLGTHLDGPHETNVEFEIPLLDPGVRHLLKAEGNKRDALRTMGDVGFRTLVFAPYAIDVLTASLVIHRNPDVAAQLALIDFEVLTLAGMTQILGSRLIARARPYVADCTSIETCRGGSYRSFLSGHVMASFTGAGLMCVHHEMLPLFGGGAPDTWACVWAVSLATLTTIFRLAADEHYASDVLLGAAAGWGFGYFLPKLLHFHAKEVTKSTNGSRSPVTWFPSLTGTTESGVLGIAGTF